MSAKRFNFDRWIGRSGDGPRKDQSNSRGSRLVEAEASTTKATGFVSDVRDAVIVRNGSDRRMGQVPYYPVAINALETNITESS